MTAIVNRTTNHLIKYARGVVAIGRLNVDPVILAIQRRFGEQSIEAALTRALLLGHCDLLERLTGEYEGSITTLAKESTEDLLAREERDGAFQGLGRMLVGARTRMRDSFDETEMRAYHLHGRNPTSYEGMLRYASDVVALMEKNPRTATDAFGATFDTGVMAAALRPAVDTYRQSLQDVAREQRETQQARASRTLSEEQFRDGLINIAAIVEAYLRMAGMDELADRVRPTLSRTSGEGESEAPATPAPTPAPAPVEV
jgi:hypothetical protein